MLGGEQPQRVAHDNIGSRVVWIAESAGNDADSSGTKVSLRLAATCGEEDEVDRTSLAVLGIHNLREGDEKEGDLERTPVADSGVWRRRWLRAFNEGLIPNRFVEHGQPDYNSIDAALWVFVAVWKYLEATRDHTFVREEALPQLLDAIAWFEREG